MGLLRSLKSKLGIAKGRRDTAQTPAWKRRNEREKYSPENHTTNFVHTLFTLGLLGGAVYFLAPRVFPSVISIEERERRSSYLYQQGNQLLAQNLIAEAEKSFRQAIQMSPTNAFALANLGTVLRERGDLKGAVMAHGQAYELTPRRARSAYNLAVSLQTAARHQEAESLYRVAIALSESGEGGQLDVANAYSNLGVVHQALFDLPQAAAMLRVALALRPSHRSAGPNLCNVLLALQGSAAAVECYEELMRGDASNVGILGGAAGMYHVHGDLTRAAQLYRQALDANPSSGAARHGLAAILGPAGGVEAPRTAPADYVKELFDGYAASFDQSLTALKYQSPRLISESLDSLAADPSVTLPAPPGSWRIIDAGCGTGLCGPLLRRLCRHIVGVDLSPKMVDAARRRGVYDEVVVGDVTETLRRVRRGGIDGIVMADVVVYIGDLAPLFHAIHHALVDNGIVALTTESTSPEACTHISAAADEPVCNKAQVTSPSAQPDQGLQANGWLLTVSGRYSHCKEYVERTAKQAGLTVVKSESVIPRWNRDQPVNGHLFILQRRGQGT